MAGDVTGETDEKDASAVAVAVAIGTATALAAPASADDQLDQALLKGLQQKGVTVSSPDQALALAHSTCDILEHGGTVNDALSMLSKKAEWSIQKSADFGGLAVYAYCKDKLPSGTG